MCAFTKGKHRKGKQCLLQWFPTIFVRLEQIADEGLNATSSKTVLKFNNIGLFNLENMDKIFQRESSQEYRQLASRIYFHFLLEDISL